MGNLYMLVGGILGLVPMSIRRLIGPLVALTLPNLPKQNQPSPQSSLH